MEAGFSKKKTTEIKALLEAMTLDQKEVLVEELLEDSRKSVQQMAVKIQKERQKMDLELERLRGLWQYEAQAMANGYMAIGGIDEAGRGPLVGPVVAACVILPQDHGLLGLDDSKKIPERKREALFTAIKERAVAFGVGMASHEEIDQINILNATKLAMKRAMEDMEATPDFLLIDAVELADIPIKQLPLIKGDSKSASIAAASVLAKVTRDQMICELDALYPGYDLSKNKGYGTATHYEGLRQLGPSPVHRMSFLKKFLEE